MIKKELMKDDTLKVNIKLQLKKFYIHKFIY